MEVCVGTVSREEERLAILQAASSSSNSGLNVSSCTLPVVPEINISVFASWYKDERFNERCLGSAASQKTLQSYEAIGINDGLAHSTGKTLVGIAFVSGGKV